MDINTNTLTHFAPVAPINILEQLDKLQILGPYHLLLAHEVLEYPERFAKLFQYRKDTTIILDNSTVELGQPMSITSMLEAYNIIKPTYVVLPDTLGDYTKTADDSRNASIPWQNAGLGPFMIVPQGSTLSEHIDCFKIMLNECMNVKAVGIPRRAANVLGTRQDLITTINRLGPFLNMHMLGFSDNLLDDIACARRTCVKGIDSAVPIRQGLKGQTISLDYPPKYRTRGDIQYDTDIPEHVINNIDLIRKWVN